MEEDQQTRQALDELAELFLTDSSVDAQRSQPEPAEAADASQASQAPMAPEVPGVSGAAEAAEAGEGAAFLAAAEASDPFEDELVGPEPMRLQPKLTPRPHLRLHREAEDDEPDSASAWSIPDPIDAAVRGAIERGQRRSGSPATQATAATATTAASSSAAGGSKATTASPGAPSGPLSFAAAAGGAEAGTAQTPASEEASQSPPEPGRAAPLTAEAVLMGNLPGLSGPWLTQYAQLLAQHVGPVVLLHVDDERIDLELIEPTDRPQNSGRVPPDRQGPRQSQDLVARLEMLTQPGPAQVQAILVHTEASPDARAVSRLKALDRWTLLCGADEAAVMGGYRLIKSVVEADATAAARRMGVMILGSEPEVGRAAAQELGAAVRPILEQPLEFVGAQRQMVPVNLRQLGRFGPTRKLWPRLAAWLRRLDGGRAPVAGPLTLAESHAPVNPPDLEATAPPDPEPADFAAAGETAEADESAKVASSAPSAPSGQPSDWAWLRDAESAAAEASASPAQAPPHAEAQARASSDREAPDEAGDEAEPNLARFLTTPGGPLPGGIVLEARCPDQPRTQLVLDERGRLHLLRRHASDEAGHRQGGGDALRRAVVDLLEARKWVAQHIELLRLTQRQCQFDTAAEPTLHLFTDRADLATGLIGRLGDTLRLHLLKQVRVGDQSTWFCTPLQPGEGEA